MTEQDTEIGELGNDAMFLRAVRSLAWNRQLLPIIQERYNRAENIVRSRLLVRGGESVHVGPYEVSLTEDQDIGLTWNGDDEWRQLHLPDVDPLVGDPLDDDNREPL